MSYTAISAVTTAIRKLFKGKMRTTQLITFLPPGNDDLEKLDGLNIYLYRVVENPYFKNRDWVGDRNNSGLPYPPLALNLLYLLTPYTKKVEDTDEAVSHQILGDAMQILHENPVLNDIHDGTFDADRDLEKDLLNSFEKVKITLFPISMDEMSKIWSASGKPYRLSVIYEVSLVQIAPAIKPKVISPVMKVAVEVAVPSPPFISDVSPPSGDVGQSVVITGERLKGRAQINFGNTILDLNTNTLTTELPFKIPSISPGNYLVRVVIDGHISNSLSFEVTL